MQEQELKGMDSANLQDSHGVCAGDAMTLYLGALELVSIRRCWICRTAYSLELLAMSS